MAHRKAFENAFRRVVIISLGNGKVAVEINQTDIPGIEGLSEDGEVHINYIEELPTGDSQGYDTEVDEYDKENTILQNMMI